MKVMHIVAANLVCPILYIMLTLVNLMGIGMQSFTYTYCTNNYNHNMADKGMRILSADIVCCTVM